MSAAQNTTAEFEQSYRILYSATSQIMYGRGKYPLLLCLFGCKNGICPRWVNTNYVYWTLPFPSQIMGDCLWYLIVKIFLQIRKLDDCRFERIELHVWMGKVGKPLHKSSPTSERIGKNSCDPLSKCFKTKSLQSNKGWNKARLNHSSMIQNWGVLLKLPSSKSLLIIYLIVFLLSGLSWTIRRAWIFSLSICFQLWLSPECIPKTVKELPP